MAWPSSALAERDSWSSIFSAVKSNVRLSPDELRKTSMFRVNRSQEAPRQCVTTTGTRVTSPSTLRGPTITRKRIGMTNLRPQICRLAHTLQQGTLFPSNAPLSFGRGNSVPYSGLHSPFLRFGNHTLPVHYRLAHSPQQAPAFVSQVNFHGATSKPGRRGNQTCLCSYCRTPASRQLDILCRSCGRVLQPRYDSYKPTGYSYFDLLELKPDFNVDLMVLDARYKALQKELHPDKNLEADEKQRAWNDEHRKQVALAVAILRCPARRVLHLLQHHFPCLPGGAEEEKVERVTDANLLAEVLELNEALERVRTRDELSFFEKRIREILQIDEKELATTYREKDVEGMKVNAQRYMMHAAFLDRIKNWAPDGA